jgi:Tol biopolymer transport system component
MSDVAARLAAGVSDRYRLDRELGAGGMATVWLAEDLRHGRKVAIKVLHPELSAVIGGTRFLAEIKVTANLQHPHILGLIDSGESDGLLYYVMPYVSGESLRGRLTRDKLLPVDEAVRLAKEVASALDYAHRQGVVHRDIKPENILLQDGAALVADFGIALAVQQAGGSRMTQTGMSLGTPSYMSPEQAMGEREIGPRSDLYALGAMTYEMLVGDPPFTGSTVNAIVAKVLTEKPIAPSRLRDTVPPAVEHAVLTALQKLPADRFASAQAFADALSSPTVTAGLSSTTIVRAPTSTSVSRRTLTTLASFAAVLLALALWGWLRPAPKATTSRQRVTLWQRPFGDFLLPGVERLATQAAIAPDGSSIVFSELTAGTYRLMRKERDARDPVPLEGTEGGVSPFFSPDGAWIGYVTTDGKVRKVPASGGGSVTLATNANPVYVVAIWMDDGTILYIDDRVDVRRVPADGGTSTLVKSDSAAGRRSTPLLAPLPGSRGFLYTSCPGNCSVGSAVYVFDFAADSGRMLADDAAGAWYSPTGHLLYTSRDGGLYAMRFDPRTLEVASGAMPVIDDVAPATFALSASGSALYAVTTGARAAGELVWVARDGRETPVDSGWRADFMYPAVSPDGKAIAVSLREESTQLWIWRADGTRQKLTQEGTVNWRPFWTADGRSVAFVSNRRGGSQDDFDIYLQHVDGRDPPAVLARHLFGLWEAEISRDGSWIVLRSDEGGSNANIRARRLHGDTALVPILVDKHLTIQVSLSPNGRWLAYVADPTGRREVYVASFPDMKSNHLVSRDGGSEPRWAHDGRELFYKGVTHLMAVDVVPGETFTSGTPRPLFPLDGFRGARNRQQYDVAPDDERFLMIRERDDGTRGQAVYVENWFEELTGKVRE